MRCEQAEDSVDDRPDHASYEIYTPWPYPIDIDLSIAKVIVLDQCFEYLPGPSSLCPTSSDPKERWPNPPAC